MQYFKDAVITDDLQKYFVLIKLKKKSNTYTSKKINLSSTNDNPIWETE